MILGDLVRLEKLIEGNRLLFLKVALLYDFEGTKVLNSLTSVLNLSRKTVQGLSGYKTWTQVENEINKCSQICKKLSGIRFGQCITAHELHLKTKNQIVCTLEKILNSAVEIEFSQSDLIGGIILELGDYRFDASYLSILDELEKRFLKNMLLEVTHE